MGARATEAKNAKVICDSFMMLINHWVEIWFY
jgi:hypothetical protein